MTRHLRTVATCGLLIAACADPGADGLSSSGAPAPAGAEEGPAPTTFSAPAAFDGVPSALRRLSRDELVTTMQVLTGTAPARAVLPKDPRGGAPPLQMAGVAFVGPDVEALNFVIGKFAATASTAMVAKSGCALASQAQRDCLVTWATTFGRSALRRPLREEETASFGTILAQADGSREADSQAVEGILTALFLSPSFLYRSTVGVPIEGKPGLRALRPDEIATKLSYLGTLGPPDAELLAAADRLRDGPERQRQLERLFATPLGRRAVAVLVLEWLAANEPRLGTKSESYLKGLGADAEAAVRSSADSTIATALASADPTLNQLLTTVSFAGDAAVVQVTRADDASGVATGDDGETGRAGLLMHPQVLAAHTKANGASPFQLGSFVKEALLCDPVGDPPAGALDKAKNDAPPGLSIREDLEYRVDAGSSCTGCHSQFAPVGFAFVAFDPVGRWVRKDPSGKPWDLAGMVPTTGGPIAFKSPQELVRNLAVHPQVHGCFAQVALKWSVGRRLLDEDRFLLAAADAVALKTGGNVPAILATIAAAPAFVTTVAPR